MSSDDLVAPAAAREGERSVGVTAGGQLHILAKTDANLERQGGLQGHRLEWINLSTDFDFDAPDIIDVWPYNGDGNNPLNERAWFDSSFSGTYELDDWLAQPSTISALGVTHATEGIWYYSNDDPTTIPYDPDAAVNNLATGSVGWCTREEMETPTAQCDFNYAGSTAARFVQSEPLKAKTEVVAEFNFKAGTEAEPSLPGDRYANRIGVRVPNVNALLRSTESLVQTLSLSVGDLVFVDADIDGLYTEGTDATLTDASVELWSDPAEQSPTLLATTTTDRFGRYIFENLAEGTYEVRIPNSELASSFGALTPTVSPKPADDDLNENADHQASASGSGYVTSGPFTLSTVEGSDPPLGLEPTGENVFRLGSPYIIDSMSNMSVDMGLSGPPALSVVKEACVPANQTCDPHSDPLDPTDGWIEAVQVLPGETVRWRTSITNTGAESLDRIVIDDTDDDCDQAPDADEVLVVLDTISWVFETTSVVANASDTASVTAAGAASDQSVSGSDAASVEVTDANLAVAIKTMINGDDAQSAPGERIAAGGEVVLTYEVSTGTGNLPLANVAVTDDNGTPSDTDDDLSPTYQSGDTDEDGNLDVGEVWLYELTVATATAGQQVHQGKAEATSTAGTETTSATDVANYLGVASGIELTSIVNGVDGPNEPGVLIVAGGSVKYTYEVSNTGNDALEVGPVIDDAGTSTDTSDDWTASYASGDTNANDLLDQDEVWVFSYDGPAASAGAHEHQSVVTGTDLLDSSVSSADVNHHFGVAADLEITLETNTLPGDEDPVVVAADSEVAWRYVVTNSGNVALGSVDLSDDNGTPSDADDDFAPRLESGDLNSDGILDLDETWVFVASGTATETAFTNAVKATAVGPGTRDSAGTALPGGVVTRSDSSSYIVEDADIELTVETNGHGHSAYPGALVLADGEVQWRYLVSNRGDAPLQEVKVTDDAGSPLAPEDDLTPVYLSGDENENDALDPGEVWVFQASGSATSARLDNRATVSAAGPAAVGSTGDSDRVPVSDSANGYYTVMTPSLRVDVSSAGSDNDEAPWVPIRTGERVEWVYSVTNYGNVPLGEIAVSDDSGTPDDPSDDKFPSYESGDTNGDGLLDVGEVWLFALDGLAVTGANTNVATASGTPPHHLAADGALVTTPTVNDSDPAGYFGFEVGLDVTVEVNGESAGGELTVMEGESLDWRFAVENTGPTPLTDISIALAGSGDSDSGDSLGTPVLVSGDTTNPGVLDPGEIWIFEGTSKALEGSRSLNVEVVGLPQVDGAADSDDVALASETVPASYFGAMPGVSISSTINGQPAGGSTELALKVGDAIELTYEIVNTGNAPLVLTEVTDSLNRTIKCPVMVLGVGESVVCSGSDTVQEGVHSSVASVSASLAKACSCPDRFSPVFDGDNKPVAVVSDTDTMAYSGSSSVVPTTLAFTGATTRTLFLVGLMMVFIGLLVVASPRVAVRGDDDSEA